MKKTADAAIPKTDVFSCSQQFKDTKNEGIFMSLF
jgi:hypothetical protein